jgi:hypothetical protein
MTTLLTEVQTADKMVKIAREQLSRDRKRSVSGSFAVAEAGLEPATSGYAI